MSDWEYVDTDYNGDLRPVIEDIDYEHIGSDESTAYVVERWGELGFDTVKYFHTEGEAIAFFRKELSENKGRYRVMGPKITWEEADKFYRSEK